MRLKILHRVGITSLVALQPCLATAAGTITCPPMPADMTKIGQNYSSELTKRTQSVFDAKSTSEVSEKVSQSSYAVFEKFPKVDRLLTLQLMSATYCSLIANSDLTSQAKLSRWDAFQSRVLALRPTGPSAVVKKPTVAASTPMELSPYERAMAALRSGKYEQANADFKNLANAGDGRAAYQLGKSYTTGRGFAADPFMAFDWFLRAANVGVREAQFNVGVAYEQGIGIPKNPALACLWFQQSAKQGTPEAQMALQNSNDCN